MKHDRTQNSTRIYVSDLFHEQGKLYNVKPREKEKIYRTKG